MKEKKHQNGKNEPILPSIRPWTNSEYNLLANELDNQYVNITMEYFADFYNTIDDYKHPEVQYFAQEMYSVLDRAVLESLRNPHRSGESIMNQLITLNSEYSRHFN